MQATLLLFRNRLLLDMEVPPSRQVLNLSAMKRSSPLLEPSPHPGPVNATNGLCVSVKKAGFLSVPNLLLSNYMLDGLGQRNIFFSILFTCNDFILSRLLEHLFRLIFRPGQMWINTSCIRSWTCPKDKSAK